MLILPLNKNRSHLLKLLRETTRKYFLEKQAVKKLNIAKELFLAVAIPFLYLQNYSFTLIYWLIIEEGKE